MTKFKKSLSFLLAAIMLLSVMAVAPVTASADSQYYSITSPVKDKFYEVDKPIEIRINKLSFEYAYSKNGSNQGNLYITVEIRHKGNNYAEAHYVTEISPNDIGKTYVDTFTPTTCGDYTVYVQERRVSFGIASKYIDEGRYYETYDFTVTFKSNFPKSDGGDKSNVKIKTAAKSIKASDLKKSNKTVKPLKITNAKSVKVTKVKKGTTAKIYKKIKVAKKTGAITFKKGKYKKGTYKVKLKIICDSKTYSKTVKVKIK